MNAAIIYESRNGNTAFLAREIAELLASYSEAHLVRVDHATATLTSVPDLLVLGGPAWEPDGTWVFPHVIEDLPRTVLEHSSFAVFDTQPRHARVWAEATSSVLARAVHQRGGALILPPESFFLFTREGPLDEGELSRALLWAREAGERCQCAPAATPTLTAPDPAHHDHVIQLPFAHHPHDVASRPA